MFDKQARFRVDEFDSEKECAAGNEVSAITRHRIFVCGLGVGKGMVCFEVPCNSQVGCVAQPRTRSVGYSGYGLLMFSDDIGGRLKALASTKLKVEKTVNQATACVRTAHTLHVGFEVPCNSQVGCVAQPRTRSVGYAGYASLAHLLGLFQL